MMSRFEQYFSIENQSLYIYLSYTVGCGMTSLRIIDMHERLLFDVACVKRAWCRSLKHKESRWRLTSNVFNIKWRRAKSATILLLYNYCTVTVWAKMTVSTSDHELASVILSFWRRIQRDKHINTYQLRISDGIDLMRVVFLSPIMYKTKPNQLWFRWLMRI